jgi:hypothetical protein
MHFHDLKIWHYLSKTQQKNGDEVPNRSGGDAGTGLNKCRPLNIACVLVSSVPERKKKIAAWECAMVDTIWEFHCLIEHVQDF